MAWERSGLEVSRGDGLTVPGGMALQPLGGGMALQSLEVSRGGSGPGDGLTVPGWQNDSGPAFEEKDRARVVAEAGEGLVLLYHYRSTSRGGESERSRRVEGPQAINRRK